MIHAIDLIQQLDRGAQSGLNRDELDSLFDSLFDAYSKLIEDQRKAVRESYKQCKDWGSQQFWSQNLSYYLRFRDHGSIGDLRRALADYSMNDGYPDARDAIVGMDNLLVIAAQHEIDPGPLFAEIAAVSNPDGTWGLRKYMLRCGAAASDTECVAALSSSLSLVVYEPPEHQAHVIIESPDKSHVEATVRGLAWSDITFVVLTRDKQNWIDFSGSRADGFSAMYAEQGIEHVITEAPRSLDEGIHLLTLYLHGDDRWRSEYDWQ